MILPTLHLLPASPQILLDSTRLRVAQFSRDGSRIFYSDVVQEAEVRYRDAWRISPAGGGAPTATLWLPPQATDSRMVPRWKVPHVPGRRGRSFERPRAASQQRESEPVTRFTERRIIGGKWSPDGRRLLLRRLLQRVDSLWTVTAEGTDPVRLTDFRTREIRIMKWKPDWSGIVFIYGSTVTDAVLIRNFRQGGSAGTS